MAKSNKKKSNRWKYFMADALDLPADVALNLPQINLLGDQRLLVENHKGIIEYSSNRVRLKVEKGLLWAEGENLVLRNLQDDEISIEGEIKQISILMGKEDEV